MTDERRTRRSLSGKLTNGVEPHPLGGWWIRRADRPKDPPDFEVWARIRAERARDELLTLLQ